MGWEREWECEGERRRERGRERENMKRVGVRWDGNDLVCVVREGEREWECERERERGTECEKRGRERKRERNRVWKKGREREWEKGERRRELERERGERGSEKESEREGKREKERERGRKRQRERGRATERERTWNKWPCHGMVMIWCVWRSDREGEQARGLADRKKGKRRNNEVSLYRKTIKMKEADVVSFSSCWVTFSLVKGTFCSTTATLKVQLIFLLQKLKWPLGKIICTNAASTPHNKSLVLIQRCLTKGCGRVIKLWQNQSQKKEKHCIIFSFLQLHLYRIFSFLCPVVLFPEVDEKKKKKSPELLINF